jgi:hypothetical protein
MIAINDREESSQKNGKQDFVQPIEAEFAKILDYYGVKWRHEPYTFPLAWQDNGDISEPHT